MILEILACIGGLLLLILGADSLVRGSSGLALRMGLSTLVVGLTVVAFGTSSPELVVSLSAAIMDSASITVGNVIGSNIANIALVLGLSALVSPLRTNAQLLRRDVPVMILATVVLVIMLSNGYLGRIEGLILFLGLLAYVTVSLRQAHRESDVAVREQFQEAVPARPRKFIFLMFLTFGGLGLLILGAVLFVQGAVGIARQLQISEIVIGLTLVAVGTSLPELATSMIASIRGKNDIAVGNVVGSNIFNIMCILGIAVLIRPFAVQGFSLLDMGAMLLTAILLLPLIRSGFVLTRWEGGLLVAIYIGYIVLLVR
jgi:cation:H+ antiporter